MSWAELLPTLTTVGKILLIIVPLLLSVAYLTLAERKIIGYMQVRLGPNRVTFFGIPWLRGWAQPIADVLKMLLKEIVVPSGANKIVFLLAPILSLAPAFVAWSVVPFSPEVVLADIDAGLLFIMAASSMGVYGVVMAGWASNSKYAFIGGLRCAAQIVSYEIAMGFALVGVLMVAGSLNLVQIVQGQTGSLGLLQWNWLPLLPLFVIYFVSGVAETNRAPFDVAEGESEIVAGFHVEYSGITFGVFFLAEYANMILISMLAAIMFLGGWLPPFPVAPFTWVPGFIWLLLKVALLLLMFLWFRATFPRYRYDQIMRLGWKLFIPITIVWLVVIGFLMQEPIRQWPPFNLWF